MVNIDEKLIANKYPIIYEKFWMLSHEPF